MGIPGFFVVLVAKPLTNLIYGALAWDAWNAKLSDRAWPLAIMLSLIWPVLIPPVWYTRQKYWPDAGFFAPLPLFAVSVAILFGCMCLGFIAVVLTGPVKRLTREERVKVAVNIGSLSVLEQNFQTSDLGRLREDPLNNAIFSRKVAIARFLIDKRSSFDGYTPPGDQKSMQSASPLHTAVSVGAVEIVRLLLEKGANPNQENSVGQTPLFAFSWDPDGDGDIVRMLKEAGADFTRIDSEGNTPLIMMTRVVHNGWPQMAHYAKLMVEAGVDPHHRNADGKSALDYARERYQDSVVEYLTTVKK